MKLAHQEGVQDLTLTLWRRRRGTAKRNSPIDIGESAGGSEAISRRHYSGRSRETYWREPNDIKKIFRISCFHFSSDS